MIITIANQKGGVGKTTTTLGLASVFLERGERILVVDCDPQGSVGSIMKHPEKSTDTLFHAFKDNTTNLRPYITQSHIPKLHYVAASASLVCIERVIQQGAGLKLKKLVDSVKNDYDKILIDCGPAAGTLQVNALACCDKLVIPCATDFLALEGTAKMVRMLSMISRSINKQFDAVILPTLFDKRTRAAQIALVELAETYPNVAGTTIPMDIKCKEAANEYTMLHLYSPTSRAYVAMRSFVEAYFPVKTSELVAKS